jgi:hypothetical protein
MENIPSPPPPEKIEAYEIKPLPEEHFFTIPVPEVNLIYPDIGPVELGFNYEEFYKQYNSPKIYACPKCHRWWVMSALDVPACECGTQMFYMGRVCDRENEIEVINKEEKGEI